MKNNWLDLILIALAVYRLTKFVMIDDGPFDLMLKARDWVFDRFDEEHWINKGLSCPWCISFWLSLVVLFLPAVVYWWLGIAGLVSLLFTWEFKDVAS